MTASLWEQGALDVAAEAEPTTVRWEYLIVSLPEFRPPTHAPGSSAAIKALNDEGDRGWEAVTMTALANGTIAVLCKRRVG